MNPVETITNELVAAFNTAKLCRESLTGLVSALGQTPQVRKIGEEFNDRAKYPDRPEYTLRDGGPSIWLLGWREGDFTQIHDHGDSDIAIYVLAGRLTEDVYGTLGACNASEYDLTMCISRQASAGEIVCCDHPYFHRMGNLYPELAVTLHAYGPKLETMRNFSLDQRRRRLVQRPQDTWRNEH